MYKLTIHGSYDETIQYSTNRTTLETQAALMWKKDMTYYINETTLEREIELIHQVHPTWTELDIISELYKRIIL